MCCDSQLLDRPWNEWSVTKNRSISNEDKTANKGDNAMNICEEWHSPKYEITYKGVLGNRYNHVWLVCQNCLKSKNGFGDKDEILKIVEMNKV